MQVTNTSSNATARLLLGENSPLNKATDIGDLSKAAEIANTALQEISQDPKVDQSEKTKVKTSLAINTYFI